MHSMRLLRSRRNSLVRLFLMIWAVGLAMVLGSFLRAVFGPLPMAWANEAQPPEQVEADAEALAEVGRRLGGLPEVDQAGRGESVVVFPVQGNIDLGLSAFLERALADAEGARVMVLDINTFGGRVDAAVQMRDRLMETDIPTVAFVHPRAISAGALIALSCDVIVVTTGASMGAATPIQVDGGEAAPVEKKFVSYLRGEFRSTAESKGRDGRVAEAMVDAEVEVEGLVGPEELLTLDDGQALEFGIADLQVDDVPALLKVLHLDAANRSDPEIAWAERLVRFLTDPIVGGLLMSIGMLGIAIELYSPGVGLPGGVGVTCLALFFFGHFMTHLAGIEEVVLILIGLVLLAVEAFVIPGFGVAGIAGLLTLCVGLVLALIGLDLSVSLETGALWMGLLRVAASLGMAVLAFLGFLYVAPQSRFASRLVLKQKVAGGASDAGTHAPERMSGEELMGREGVAVGDLRPSGVARIDDERVDVVTEGDYVVEGSRVKVVEVHGNRVVVRALEGE
jgi:membrane-bound serine protease (ClpP class)